MGLQGRGLRRPEEAVDFRDRRSEAHRREQLARRAQRFLCFGLAEGGEAAALAEQGVRALGHVPELAPALGRVGVQGCGLDVLLGSLGELGARGAERVLDERRARLDAVRRAGRRASGSPSASAVRTSSGRTEA